LEILDMDDVQVRFDYDEKSEYSMRRKLEHIKILINGKPADNIEEYVGSYRYKLSLNFRENHIVRISPDRTGDCEPKLIAEFELELSLGREGILH